MKNIFQRFRRFGCSVVNTNTDKYGRTRLIRTPKGHSKVLVLDTRFIFVSIKCLPEMHAELYLR